MDDALSHLDVLAYGRAKSTLNRMNVLFDAVANSPDLKPFSPTPAKPPDDLGRRGDKRVKDSWYVELTQAWPALDESGVNGGFDLMLAQDDEWVPDALVSRPSVSDTASG